MPAFIEETGFRQVILNLVINARDAIERTGRIKLSLKKVKKGKVIMKGAVGEKRIAHAEGAEIALSDNGKGIPIELQEKIFDPFVTSKPSGSGSGFGLYNTKIFIEDHNGLIGFSTTKGKGTTFYLFLPLEIDEEEKPAQKVKRAKRATRAFIKTTKN
jgi:signal transduction histidine kinase